MKSIDDKIPPLPDEQAAQARRRLLICAILAVAAGFDAFANSVIAPFVLDDSNGIQKNATIRDLRDISAVFHPPLDSAVAGRPVINFTLAANYALGGLHPVGYHILNLLVHLSATLALFGIVRRTLLRPVIPECFRKGACELACVIAAIWAVHPIQTGAVTYVIQRCESIMGLMYLLSLYCLIRSAGENGPSLPWQILAVAACGIGMVSKEVMVTAPVMLLLYDRTFLTGSLAEVFRKRWKFYSLLAMTWGLLVVSLIQSGMHSNQFQFTVKPHQYALNETTVILHYLGLVFWPKGLSLVYYWPAVPFEKSMLPGVLVVAAMLAATIGGLVLNRPWGWLGAWFFGILSVTSSFVPQFDLAFEHRMYLPLVAVVALTVLAIYRAGWWWLARTQKNDRYIQTVRRIGLAAAVAVCLTLMILTINRNHDYHSELSIWSDTVAKQPKSKLARLGLANALIEEGRNLEAVEALQEAIRIDPKYTEGRVCMSCAYMGLGDYSKALEQLEETIRISPGYYLAYYNRGVVYMNRRQYQQAVDDFNKALSLRPGFENAANDLKKVQDFLAGQPATAPAASRNN